MMKALALSVTLCLAVTAHADENKERAQKLVNEGVALLNQNKPAEALAKLRSAYSAYQAPSILLNIGTALRNLGRHAEAANAYARWIRAKTTPQHKAEVESILADLDAKVGKVVLEIDVDDATVAIDGEPVEVAGGVVRLEPGGHTIVATKDGRTAQATVQVSAGQSDTVELSLATSEQPPETGDGTPPVTDPGPDSDPDPEIGIETTPSEGGSGTVLKIAGISTAAVGLVAIGVGVKFGLDANNINEELESVGGGGNDPSMWSQDLIDKFEEGESAETRFIVFTAIGGAAVIAGGVMAVLGFTSGRAERDGLALTPSVTAESAGWVLSGSF